MIRYLAAVVVVIVAAGLSSGAGAYSLMTADGRLVGFESDAPNLVRADTNGHKDVFVRDRVLLTTERVSVGVDGEEGNGDSYFGSVSADGRFVAFTSAASNLVPGDTNASSDALSGSDVFVRDRVKQTTERVSVSSSGGQAKQGGGGGTISADGRYVVFASNSPDLVPDDTNGEFGWDVFVRDRLIGTTERVNVSSSGAQTRFNSNSLGGALSADGRYVMFDSNDANLVADDTNKAIDVFVRDRQTGTTERVSVGNGGTQADRWSGGNSFSLDGRYIAFDSPASNLVAGDTNSEVDVFVHDRKAGTTERVSVDTDGGQRNMQNRFGAMSGDGRYVSFNSYGREADWELFLHDRETGTTEHISFGGPQVGDYYFGTPSADGRFLVLEPFVVNRTQGVLLRDQVAGTTELVSRPTTPAKAGTIALRPRLPRAGRSLTATMPIRVGGKPALTTKITCTATVAGTAVPVTGRSYRAGLARCIWRLPIDSTSKPISGSLTAVTPNGTVGRHFKSHIS